jgi:hypothetical protein
MIPTYKDAEGEEVVRPEGEETKPEFKNDLFGAIKANLKSAEAEELAMGDVEEAERIRKEEEGIEKET